METKRINSVDYRFINDELIIDDNTQPIDYDSSYLEHYEKLSSTKMSADICNFRRALTEAFIPGTDGGMRRKALDYGCGYSPIIKGIYDNKHREEFIDWYGYDVNPLVAELKHMREARYDFSPDFYKYDAVCFFDVLEHCRDYRYLLATMRRGAVAVVTVPVVPAAEWRSLSAFFPTWRHFKPGEHFIYGTVSGWHHLFEKHGFSVEYGTDFESCIGRLDSWTIVARKK